MNPDLKKVIRVLGNMPMKRLRNIVYDNSKLKTIHLNRMDRGDCMTWIVEDFLNGKMQNLLQREE